MFSKLRSIQGCNQAIRHPLKARQLGQSLLLGLAATLWAGSTATAAETITLQYLDDQVTVSLENLENFARTGEPASEDLQEFVQENPEIGQIIQDLLTAEVYISESFLRDALESSTGEFVLLRLNEFISSNALQEDVTPIRTALLDSYEDDNRFSLLELLDNFPENEIAVNLTSLQPVYQDVKTFVERIYPALEVARGFLQDLVCDCAAASATPAPDTSEPDASEPDASEPDASEPDASDTLEPDASEPDSPQSALPEADRPPLSAQGCRELQSVTHPSATEAEILPSQPASESGTP